MQLYERGIRRRLAPMLDGDRRRLELAYSLMFTLPGTPVLRYGDELGMGDDLSLPERNCARTPMQWSNEPHGGFTKSDKARLPVISGGPYGFEHINAAIQRRHPDSLLNWTERIIRMRKEVPEIGWGDFAVIPIRDPAVLVIRYDWRNNSALFVHNLDAKPREIAFPWTYGSAGRAGQPPGQSLERGPQPRRQARKHRPRDRGLRLPLVSRRRTGLSAAPHRDRSAAEAVAGCRAAGLASAHAGGGRSVQVEPRASWPGRSTPPTLSAGSPVGPSTSSLGPPKDVDARDISAFTRVFRRAMRWA